ncbi:hypothetical protein KL942_001882 [Ogataea angusta]|uniref:Histone-binding protein RBBP4-like N-terminal domain-containing protein n=1 Tax=Pichia angusta TaxID=870730 RepID=A0AAN6DH15_PICAN|nr:uncharacterized protein KL928_001678 [Ogataea angusta]KAG7820241.1 hypothetical protein KL928_001678 [Ogataea angusta]KAG7838478.1 hypothetical protein KL943_000554 [Ogataea angusta]KAG7840894.1 hypothetical protein KL942_001882 [Ogataea angusta]KAG7846934.1 hypothetical protein KL941_002727 [Ogataea angusta]KAG7849955.1 hypothetical protein KL940_002323 [Ogataea angusta]
MSSKQVSFGDLPIESSDDEHHSQDEEKSEELTILEEYKLWRKNCRYMYDFISETALTWPSLSIQWIPGGTFENKTKDTKISRTRNLLLTTHTSGEDVNYLKIASTQIPASIWENGPETTPEELQQINSRLRISKKLDQDSEINRVRAMPQNPRVISTINGKGDVFVYHLDAKMNEENKTRLVCHTENGYGLSWNPSVKGELATCSDDQTVAVWDIARSGLEIKPTNVFTNHTSIVNDVRWHNFSGNTLGSVSEDKHFIYQDKRTIGPAIDTILSTRTSFNTLCFSRFSRYLFSAGGEDGNVYLYDLRDVSKPLHIMMGHTKSITNLEWDPFHENIVGSSSSDRRIILWDINKIGKEQLQDEMEDGVPELLMMHGGHTGGINDFQFSEEIPWTVASCADDNIVHLWKVNKKVVEEEPSEVDLAELE